MSGEQDSAKVHIVYTTFPDVDSARQVAARLLESRLIACANILPGMISVFRWEGAVQDELEVAVILKTRSERLAELVSAVEAHHPYETPAILPIAVDAAAPAFAAWVCGETGAVSNS